MLYALYLGCLISILELEITFTIYPKAEIMLHMLHVRMFSDDHYQYFSRPVTRLNALMNILLAMIKSADPYVLPCTVYKTSSFPCIIEKAAAGLQDLKFSSPILQNFFD
jgi:hypothetical protein